MMLLIRLNYQLMQHQQVDQVLHLSQYAISLVNCLPVNVLRVCVAYNQFNVCWSYS